MKRRLITALICSCAIAAGSLQPGDSLAHSGRTNRHGCHNETATGGYHCHGRTASDSDGFAGDLRNFGRRVEKSVRTSCGEDCQRVLLFVIAVEIVLGIYRMITS